MSDSSTSERPPQAHSPLCWVVGEAWKRPLIARTLYSLERSGMCAQAIDYWSIGARQPQTFRELVRHVLEQTGEARSAVIVPAGSVVGPLFPRALDRFLEQVRTGRLRWQQFLVDRAPRVPMLAQGITAGRPTSRRIGLDGIPGYLDQRYRCSFLDTVPPVSSREATMPAYAIDQGRGLFQALARDPRRQAFERPLAHLTADALATAPRGSVYRCNTESVSVNVAPARGCDTIVAVAAGIKPWYLANEFRNSLRRLIILDRNPSQLRFAFEAHAAIGTASSWSEICDRAAYSSRVDGHQRARSDEIYARLRARRPEWRFQTVFLQCDILAQTFRLVDFVRAERPRKVLFWYSNIFHPRFGDRGDTFSEDHGAVHRSFVRLMQDELQGVVLYADRPEPSPKPAVATKLGRRLRSLWGLR